jgi:16S rRNA G966 N2-methylase RsmD
MAMRARFVTAAAQKPLDEGKTAAQRRLVPVPTSNGQVDDSLRLAAGGDSMNLYKYPMPSARTGAIYNAFSYATKIDAEAVAVFVASHTKPGDTVLDVFGGSGTTGIAARLCDRPTSRMRDLARGAGVNPAWGPRKAVVYELSPIGALLGQVMANPPDPIEFSAAAKQLLDDAARSVGWAYAATSPDGRPGRIRHIIWSEVLGTPCCGHRLTLWDAAIELDPLVFNTSLTCPACSARVMIADCSREMTTKIDPVTGKPISQRDRRPVRVYGSSSHGTWSRPPTNEDLRLIAEVEAMPVPSGVPTGPIDWGDLHRSGYHAGISRFHHLYTPRNFRAVAELWRRAEQFQGTIRDALRLLVLSYNASHSTLLTRVVVKKGQKDFVVSGAQTGVLYISGLPVEKNVLEGVRRKVKTFAAAFALTYGSKSDVEVVNGSSTNLHLADDSVDYVFTDPPFGDFIPYAEVNQLNEAWLGRLTNRRDEVIVSPAQGKGVDEYARLMAEVFSEVSRVLRPTGAATVVFHASKPSVWHALGEAFRRSALEVERTSVLDKVQVSFKQVVHEGGTRGDALFLLRPLLNTAVEAFSEGHPLNHVLATLERAAGDDPRELLPRRLYSRYVARCIEAQAPVALAAADFYAFVAERQSSDSRGVV